MYKNQVFINAGGNYGYNVVAYSNNLEQEKIVRGVIDICAWLTKHYNNTPMRYTFDYADGSSHYVVGIWKDGHMIDIETDYIKDSNGNIVTVIE